MKKIYFPRSDDLFERFRQLPDDLSEKWSQAKAQIEAAMVTKARAAE